MFGSVLSDQLVLQNYCVIISEFQKGSFMGVKAKKLVKKWKKTKLLGIAWFGEQIDRKCCFEIFEKYGRVAAAH